MTAKDVLRSQVMAQVVEGKLDQASAASRLGISVRQVKRLKRRLQDEGTQGLLSKKRSVPSNRRTPPDVMAKAIALIGKHYADFGPTLACEKLQELHEIKLSVETVRQAMLGAGLWKARRGAGIRTHAIRERRARRGELIQIDGSPHDWFEGRAPRCCLLVFIDDATSELMALRFVDTETTLGYMGLLEQYVLEHGLPAAIYSDRHSIFQVNRGDRQDVSHTQTQFARALEQLGIEGIQANSPQAKGRVERANQTLQDRLVKEMRLQGIDSQEQANAWLPQFMRALNRRFAVTPSLPSDAHVPYAGTEAALRRILSIHSPRRLSSNLSCQLDGLLYQVQPADRGLALRGADVTIVTNPASPTEVLWQGRILPHTLSSKAIRQQEAVDGKEVNRKVDRALNRRTPPQPVGHPWKKKMSTAPGKAPPCAQFEHIKAPLALAPAS
ncbi:ISNCY family transposase [Massilia sp. MS-15]|uniref:ISNCY family transposase n=1 Tax=Massilia sp. MS-15 TaxID=2878200 RepID=UPI001CD75EBB|nr:ISNCY family transposase [Massilia sp. MS-15]MCA1248904.1 ISNCY family transposase [Massilia sp. MS-15]